jgi:hypothetical protein
MVAEAPAKAHQNVIKASCGATRLVAKAKAKLAVGDVCWRACACKHDVAPARRVAVGLVWGKLLDRWPPRV